MLPALLLKSQYFDIFLRALSSYSNRLVGTFFIPNLSGYPCATGLIRGFDSGSAYAPEKVSHQSVGLGEYKNPFRIVGCGPRQGAGWT